MVLSLLQYHGFFIPNYLIMKIFALIVVFISLFSLKQVSSQQIESLHSVKLGFPDITYSYEHALGRQFSLNMEAGAHWSWKYSNHSTEIIISPVLKIEPRLYYSVKRRFEIGRFTNNSTSFFCVTSSFHSAIFQEYRRVYLSVIPKWGFRRAMGKHFIFETQLGAGVYFYRYSHLFGPGLDLKFGYVF